MTPRRPASSRVRALRCLLVVVGCLASHPDACGHRPPSTAPLATPVAQGR